MGVPHPLRTECNGRQWALYSASYTTPDGRFAFYFYAISDYHAAMLLQELKETAVLDGRMGACIQ